MSNSAMALKLRINQYCGAVTDVTDSVFRFTRRGYYEAYATCFVDVSGIVPKTQLELTSYLDRVIGPTYFDGPVRLQWSTYLYYVVADDFLLSAYRAAVKEMIESDRRYARKFVVTASELEEIIAPYPTAEAPLFHESIVTQWLSRLESAGLDEAVLSDAAIGKRVASLERARPVVNQVRRRRPPTADQRQLLFLKSLELVKFRAWPAQRRFSFGDVNLLHGPNGSGKTSLVEAIELLYCGRNKRTKHLGLPAYRLNAEYQGGERDVATSERPRSLFRDRNLLWYGEDEIKTNNLCDSFGRYNFLDTDAAVAVAEMAGTVEEQLARLLLGSEASRIWSDLERLQDAVGSRLRELDQQERREREELLALQRRWEFKREGVEASSAMRSRLDELLAQLGWVSGGEVSPQRRASVLNRLAEAVGILEQSVALTLQSRGPLTVAGLRHYSKTADSATRSIEAAAAKLRSCASRRHDAERHIKRLDEARVLARRAGQAARLGIFARLREVARLEGEVAKLNRVAGLDDRSLDAMSEDVARLSQERLDQALLDAAAGRAEAEAMLRSRRDEFEKVTRIESDNASLRRQLLETAMALLEIVPYGGVCPLCRTTMAADTLLTRLGAAQPEVSVAAQLGLSVEAAEGEVRRRSRVAASLTTLEQYRQQTQLPADVLVGSLLHNLQATRDAFDASRDALSEAQRQLAVVAQGMSLSQVESDVQRLARLEFGATDDAAILTAEQRVERAVQTAQKTLRAVEKEVAMLESSIANSLEKVGLERTRPERALAVIRERGEVIGAIIAKIDDLHRQLPWRDDVPLAQLLVQVNILKELAADVQVTEARERRQRAAEDQILSRQPQLESRVLSLSTTIQRLRLAHSTLASLRSELSLKRTVDITLGENRSRIEAIFRSIHVPSEFQGLGRSLNALVRRSDGQEITFAEISTGQRAALALSVFLAQNAQATTAPPVLLIDDPIAHVDDLNALSFLDFLRELALTRRRQVFFATADERLAQIFERKFEFLGPTRFKRFDLGRRGASGLLDSATLDGD